MMEEVKTGNDTTLATVTPQGKVLAIGDSCIQKSVNSNDTFGTFKDDCTIHLARLLMGARVPIGKINDWGTSDRFTMEIIEDDNKTKSCHFHCQSGVKFTNNGNGYYSLLVNAEAIMHEVRKRLKGESWKSKYVMELPLKSKPNPKKYGTGEMYDTHHYINDVIGSVFLDEEHQLFQFLYYLHKEYVKEKTQKCP